MAVTNPRPQEEAVQSKDVEHPTKDRLGRRCRMQWEPVMNNFLAVLDRAARNGSIDMEQVHRLAAAFLRAEGPLAEYYAKSEGQCMDAFAAMSNDHKRQDHLGRLIAKPFAGLFTQPGGGLDRRHLPQFFSTIRMILGDEVHADLRARAKLIAEAHRDENGVVNWEGFHGDPRAVRILDRVRAMIAKSFRRFDPRKDWLLLVMNQAPVSVSLGSNMFVQKGQAQREVPPFTERQMLRLFDALFADCAPGMMSAERQAALAGLGDALDQIRQFRQNVRIAAARLGGV